MNKLNYQFKLIQAIRNFFLTEGFIDVLTPPMVENPGMETHIHPFAVNSCVKNRDTDLYLHTSPEFHMKKILAENNEFKDIFTISYCFRDEPESPIHRSQFLMLEWYRKNVHYEKIMDDVEELIKYTQQEMNSKDPVKSFQRVTISEIFQEFLNINILDFLDKGELKNKIKKDFKDVPIPNVDCAWDDYYFLLFLNKIEPHLKNFTYLLLKEFPAPLSALSTIKETDPRVCERFEVYMNGIELCNCFNELTSFEEQIKRFKEQASEKETLYDYTLPWPEEFLNVLKNGYPKSAGIALGVERLLHCLTKVENPFYS